MAVPKTNIIPKPLTSGDYNVFMSPLPPLTPTIRDGIPRQFDWPTGYNISYIPRTYEGISFEQLRAMADSDYLVRECIETRKDQVSKLTWRVGLKAKTSEPHQKVRERSEADPRVKRVEDFLKKPDGIHNFHAWVRMWFEDMLVADCASILVGRKDPLNTSSEITRLVPADGGTIHLNISPKDGTRPRHPDPAYQQIIKGQVYANLTDRQLLYMPRNIRTHRVYGMSPVEQIIFMINMGLRRDMSKLAWFTDGTIPDAVAQVPADWSPDVIRQFQEAFDAALQGNVQARRMLRFIPALNDGKSGGQITVFKEAMLMDQWEEWRARVVAFCFSLPPNAFVKMMNRATAQSSQRQALEEGFEPSKIWLSDTINEEIIQNPYVLNEPDIELNWDEDEEVDALQQAQVDKIYVSIGKTSIDELRIRDGQEPVGVGPFVLTAQGPIMLEDVKSGDGRVTPGNPPMARLPGANGKPGSPGAKTPQLGPTKVPDQIPEKTASKMEKADGDKKKLTFSPGSLPSATETRIRSLGRLLSHFLKQQGKRIAATVADAYSEVHKTDDDEARRIADQVRFEWDGIVDGTRDALSDTGRQVARDVLLGIGISNQDLFNQVNRLALDYATERAAELVGKKMVDGVLVDNPDARWAITDTTREELRNLVSKAFSEGITPGQLQDAIEESFQFSQVRAEMIARTELARAHIQGAITGAKESGVVVKKYSMLGSEHTLTVGVDECDANVAAGNIPVDAMFPTGDPGPPYHPNCVCSLEFIYRGEE